jgi:hypothetical protein
VSGRPVGTDRQPTGSRLSGRGTCPASPVACPSTTTGAGARQGDRAA